jgi:hypothetical protein
MVQEKMFGWFCKFTDTEITANLARSVCVSTHTVQRFDSNWLRFLIQARNYPLTYILYFFL